LGDLESARDCYTESLEIRRELGEDVGLEVLLSNLGAVLKQLDEEGEARKVLDEAVEAWRAISDGVGLAGALHSLGDLLVDVGEPAVAKELFGAE
jgi:tetratricopeptide (TPR) repeat protein